ncbi:AAA family ATPase [Geobacter anodireducens]
MEKHLLQLYRLLGAIQKEPNHWILETQLNDEDLEVLWFAIASDLLKAGSIKSVIELPVCSTSFGLGIFAPIRLDLLRYGGMWANETNRTMPPRLYLIIAGMAGVGKTTTALILSKILGHEPTPTITTREQRANKNDFTTYVTDSFTFNRYKREPAYFYPIKFRDRLYQTRTASLIDIFLSANPIILTIDSHPSRIMWKKTLLPELKIVWLDASEDHRINRIKDRLAENDRISDSYLSSVDNIRNLADLSIVTDTLAPEQVANEIIIYLQKEKLL